MDRSQFDASFEGHNVKIDVSLELYIWEEDSDHYVYAPALDLIGSGDSEEEGKESFQIVLEEYVKYTYNKSTLFDDLEEQGWYVNRKKKRVQAPTAEELEEDRETLKDVLKSGNYHKENQSVALAQ
jgi:hypothetical protein